MIVSTNKTALGYKKLYKRDSFYTKGRYCVYSANKKGKALEAIVDSIASGGVFVFDDIANKRIIICYINNLKNSIVFNIEANFTWNKFNSILKTILIKEGINIVLIRENSEIKKKVDQTINISLIEEKLFLKKYKKAKTLETQKTYIIKDVLVGMVLVGVFFFQIHFFENLSEKNKMAFYEAKKELEKEIRKIRIDIKKTQDAINEMPSEVANNYSEIVHINTKKKVKR